MDHSPSASAGQPGAPTIADVARLAGVSTATVSRALSDPAKLRPGTLARVEEAVRATGYIPNLAARTLRAGRTSTVLVVVPDIANPFFADVLRGIDETLSARGYGLLIGNLANRDDRDGIVIDIIQAGQVDGVILLNGRVPKAGGRVAGGVPMVAVCEPIPGAEMPQVEVQNREAGVAAAEILVGLGHRQFAYIAGPPANILERERQAGFRDGLAEAGIAGAPVVFAGDFTLDAGAQAASAFLALQPHPTAVFAANDEMAIGFIKTVQRAGLRVPEDVSVIGFDDIAFSAYVTPTLTTFRQPRAELGRQGAGLLLDCLRGDGPTSAPLRLETELLRRESAGPAPPG